MHFHKDNIVAKILSITFSIMTYGFLTTSVFGQSTYSDVWVDDDLNVYACGTTDDTYNMYNHQARVRSTLTSPNGRVDSMDTGYAGTYACANAYLPFDENEISGLFQISSEHEGWCPIVFQAVIYGTTYASIDGASGDSRVIYKKDFCVDPSPNPPVEYYCEFVVVDPEECLVGCKTPRITKGPYSAPVSDLHRIVSLQAWYRIGTKKRCLPFLITNTDFPLGAPYGCAELED